MLRRGSRRLAAARARGSLEGEVTADTYAFLRSGGKVGHDAFAVIRESIREMNKVVMVLTNCEHIIALEPMDKGLVDTPAPALSILRATSKTDTALLRAWCPVAKLRWLREAFRIRARPAASPGLSAERPVGPIDVDKLSLSGGNGGYRLILSSRWSRQTY